MVSNGVWSPRQREWILKNVDELSISFDGMPGTQNAQRPFASGHGSSVAVMKTLRALDQAGLHYGIRMTAIAPWNTQLPADVSFICHETGCQSIQVEPAFNTQRGQHQGPTEPESMVFADAFMDAFEIACQSHRELVYSGARPWLLATTFCTAPHNALIVNPLGKMVGCYEITNDAHPLAELSTFGNVDNSRVAVDNARRNALLAHLDEGKAACHDCFCQWHCAGDCYTRAYFGALNATDGVSPRCRMNREITARMLLWYIAAGDGVWHGQNACMGEMQLTRVF